MNDLQNILKIYGDLVFDLCESTLRSSSNAQAAFRSILKEIKKRHAQERFVDHQRAWVLKITCKTLRSISNQNSLKLTASEQIELDAFHTLPQRMKRFDRYFRRLETEDQILLLLRDKYGIPLLEISTAMETPEGSLKTRRQRALRTLENWLWESA